MPTSASQVVTRRKQRRLQGLKLPEQLITMLRQIMPTQIRMHLRMTSLSRPRRTSLKKWRWTILHLRMWLMVRSRNDWLSRLPQKTERPITWNIKRWMITPSGSRTVIPSLWRLRWQPRNHLMKRGGTRPCRPLHVDWWCFVMSTSRIVTPMRWRFQDWNTKSETLSDRSLSMVCCLQVWALLSVL